MPQTLQTSIKDLPETVSQILSQFVEDAKNSFQTDLRSIVLYGSGAENKLRATSDVNVIVVLSAFNREKVDKLREPFRLAQATIRLTVMFLLENEVSSAIESFSVKFSDILHRRRVLYGSDLFANISVPRPVTIARLKQVLLNLSLRLRESYVLKSLREEQLALVIADAAGPLRSCAATILELKGQPASSPKEALGKIIHSFSEPDWEKIVSHLSEARENRVLPPGVAAPTLFRLIELANRLRQQVEKI